MEYTQQVLTNHFVQHHFDIMLMRGEKSIPSLGHVCVEFVCSPVCLGFLQILNILSLPSFAHKVNWSVYIVPVWVWVCSVSCYGRAFCPGWIPALRSELLGTAPAFLDIELEQMGWKLILFLLIFPKCMYNSHLFQCLLSGVFWVFI